MCTASEEELKLISRAPLDIDEDLADVMDIVYPVAPSWKEVGVNLHIPMAKLNTIESDRRDNNKDCLLHLLAEWLQKNYDTVTHGLPTWRGLSRAVCKINGDVFRQIAERHKVTIAAASSRSVENKANPIVTLEPSSKDHPALLERPTAKMLQLIKYKDTNGERIAVRPEETLAKKWREVGTQFGFEEAKLDIWQTQYQNDKARAHAVLAHWLADGSNPAEEYPLTWKGLLDLCEDLQEKVLKKSIYAAVVSVYESKPR